MKDFMKDSVIQNIECPLDTKGFTSLPINKPT